MNTIAFRTPTQAAIFECELKGQISDGTWENTPGTGWQEWCSADVLVASTLEQVGRNFHPRKDNFNFARKDLVDIVGQRMKNYARLALAGVALSDIRRLADAVCDLDGNWRGVPTYAGDYHDRVRTWLKRWNLNWVEPLLAYDHVYGDAELKADLTNIKAACRRFVAS